MRTHKLNLETSKSVYESCKDKIALKQCYFNVFCVTDNYTENFKSGKWKVAYGFLHCFDDLYVRHCYILDEHDRVIDPTLMIRNSIPEKDYITFFIAEYNEYIDMILENHCFPDLVMALKKKENEIRKENPNLVLCG